MMLNGHDVLLEDEHRDLLAESEHTGVLCSRCLHDHGCEHTAHLVAGLRRMTEEET